MDSIELLFSLLEIAACIVLVGIVLTLLLAAFLPKQQRGEVFRRIGRWLLGFL
jgi:type II secretory pathway pseudopilin PulG